MSAKIFQWPKLLEITKTISAQADTDSKVKTVPFEDFASNAFSVTITRVQQAALKQAASQIPSSEQLAAARRAKKTEMPPVSTYFFLEGVGVDGGWHGCKKPWVSQSHHPGTFGSLACPRKYELVRTISVEWTLRFVSGFVEKLKASCTRVYIRKKDNKLIYILKLGPFSLSQVCLIQNALINNHIHGLCNTVTDAYCKWCWLPTRKAVKEGFSDPNDLGAVKQLQDGPMRGRKKSHLVEPPAFARLNRLLKAEPIPRKKVKGDLKRGNHSKIFTCCGYPANVYKNNSCGFKTNLSPFDWNLREVGWISFWNEAGFVSTKGFDTVKWSNWLNLRVLKFRLVADYVLSSTSSKTDVWHLVEK